MKSWKLITLVINNVMSASPQRGRQMLCGKSNEQIKAILFHPFGYLLERIFIVLHMLHQGQNKHLSSRKCGFNTNYLFTNSNLKHFYGKYSVIRSLHFKRANISNYNIQILQLKIPNKRATEAEYWFHVIKLSSV